MPFGAYYYQLRPADQETRRVFKSVTAMRELGGDLAGRKNASEEDLKTFQNQFVDTLVGNNFSERRTMQVDCLAGVSKGRIPVPTSAPTGLRQ